MGSGILMPEPTMEAVTRRTDAPTKSAEADRRRRRGVHVWSAEIPSIPTHMTVMPLKISTAVRAESHCCCVHASSITDMVKTSVSSSRHTRRMETTARRDAYAEYSASSDTSANDRKIGCLSESTAVKWRIWLAAAEARRNVCWSSIPGTSTLSPSSSGEMVRSIEPPARDITAASSSRGFDRLPARAVRGKCQ